MSDFVVSAHAKERYVQRIMGYDDDKDITKFINEHGDSKIVQDIQNMLQYGEIIYTGVQTAASSSKNNKNTVVEVYLNGLWILIVDKADKRVITLYKVELGAGEEFDKIFIDKLKTQLAEKMAEVTALKEKVRVSNDENRKTIQDNQDAITDYRRRIKLLEDANEVCNNQIKLSNTDVEMIETEARDILAKLIAKKVF